MMLLNIGVWAVALAGIVGVLSDVPLSLLYFLAGGLVLLTVGIDSLRFVKR